MQNTFTLKENVQNSVILECICPANCSKGSVRVFCEIT